MNCSRESILFWVFIISILFSDTVQPLILNSKFVITDEWWQLDVKFYVRNVTNNIYVRKLNLETLNTCYKYVIINHLNIILKTNDFCYPSLIIGGVGKCGTSVMYKLLTIANNSLPASIKKKEYCLEWKKKKNNIYSFFDGLPKVFDNKTIIVSGCGQPASNIKFDLLLRHPKSTYIIMTRNFVDSSYSAYNFFCGEFYDSKCYGFRSFTKEIIHKRSAKSFHDIVVNNYTYGNYSPISVRNPRERLDWNVSLCEGANDFFRYPIEQQYSKTLNKSINSIIIIKSEHFDQNVSFYANILSRRIGLVFDKKEEEILMLQNGLINSNDLKSYRFTSYLLKNKTIRNVYNISNYEPVLQQTRNILTKCWYNDCIWINQFLTYKYNCTT